MLVGPIESLEISTVDLLCAKSAAEQKMHVTRTLNAHTHAHSHVFVFLS